jgi:hypothetical protein
VYRAPNSRSIRSVIRARIHRWSGPNPYTNGPRSSCSPRRRSWASDSRQVDRPDPLDASASVPPACQRYAASVDARDLRDWPAFTEHPDRSRPTASHLDRPVAVNPPPRDISSLRPHPPINQRHANTPQRRSLSAVWPQPARERNAEESISLHIGGRAIDATSTSSRPASAARWRARASGTMPSCSPSGPINRM